MRNVQCGNRDGGTSKFSIGYNNVGLVFECWIGIDPGQRPGDGMRRTFFCWRLKFGIGFGIGVTVKSGI